MRVLKLDNSLNEPDSDDVDENQTSKLSIKASMQNVHSVSEITRELQSHSPTAQHDVTKEMASITESACSKSLLNKSSTSESSTLGDNSSFRPGASTSSAGEDIRSSPAAPRHSDEGSLIADVVP